MPIPELAMPDGQAYSCLACGAGGVQSLDQSDVCCAQCGGTTSLRRCLRCSRLLIMGPSITVPTVPRWKCLTCGKEAARWRWPLATIGDLSEVNADLASLYRTIGVSLRDAESDPERRRLDGQILEFEGFSGIASGGATVRFDRDQAIVSVGTIKNYRLVSYSEMIALQFAGRGAFTTQTGGGWAGGGFGMSGALEGALLAGVLNKLTTVSRSHVETIVTLYWQSGRLVLLNTKYTPQQMASFLTPVVRRIENSADCGTAKHRRVSGESDDNSLVGKIRELVALRDAGMLNSDEFAAAKARLLGV